jgi:soluble lytic murein transglycosylase
MGTNKIGIRSLIAILMVSILTYNGLGFANNFHTHFFSLDAEARTQHAKELLGNSYDGSTAQKFENPIFLGEAMQTYIFKSLPSKYKDSALEIAVVLAEESERYQIDPVFLIAIIKTESSFNPNARGSAGEIGLMQIKPDTAEWIAEKYGIPWNGSKTLEDPMNNLRIGAAFFDWLRNRFDGKAQMYTAAYNMGAAMVIRLTAEGERPTIYPTRVMANYRKAYDLMSKSTASKSLVAGN